VEDCSLHGISAEHSGQRKNKHDCIVPQHYRRCRGTWSKRVALKVLRSTGPAVDFPIVRSATALAGREVTQNARLLAMAAQVMDDAYVAVLDAKYHYRFWRPITAIRDADIDGNDATGRDPTWVPLIETPMHPEYPCAHCISAAAVGAVLQVELGGTSVPKLQTVSTTLPGVVRSWTRIEDLVKEVAEARIYDGVHFHTSTEVGARMGKQVGETVARRYIEVQSVQTTVDLAGR